MSKFTDFFEPIDPKLRHMIAKKYDVGVGIMACTRFGRVVHIHITQLDSAGEPKPEMVQTLTAKQFIPVMEDFFAAKSWLEVMNLVDKARSA